MRDLPVFETRDDLPRPDNRDPAFEDSAVLAWRDPATEISGYLRMGQSPGAGRQSVSFGLVDPGGLLAGVNAAGVTLAAKDRSRAGMAYAHAIDLDLERGRMLFDVPEATGFLRIEDQHPRFDLRALAGLPLDHDRDDGHFAVAGRVRGRLRLGDRTIDVDAPGFRDRAWGVRDWTAVQAVRWWQAVWGRDRFVGMATVTGSYGTSSFGYEVRDGAPRRMERPAIRPGPGDDGLPTCRSATAFPSVGGRSPALSHREDDAIAIDLGGRNASLSIGVAGWGGRKGLSTMEVLGSMPVGQDPDGRGDAAP